MEEGKSLPSSVVTRDPLSAAIEPALKVGAACAGAGFLFGSAAGIVRGLPPGLSGGISALQTFAIGTVFSMTRTGIVQAWTVNGVPPVGRDLTIASTIAGAVSGGGVGFIARGRGNVLPGAIMFSLFGAAGQSIYNRWTTPKEAVPKQNFWKRMAEKSWTPFKVLSNEEYAEMLKEKMLRVDVEIAILDDKIAALKEQQLIEESSISGAAEGTNDR
ncbi:hypothetical protein DOTSEDRAFT_165921 [Dothistroma septosporum NZE10]|uniref:Uncharacterized protein n=1 Tax=Dothistroma septosporum (strain NZE10 / CBS 128990) TaxID=675120 RepID=N1PUJ0_DOTSN|nr:hypothetical protein DOTSEDRAFT_165921 [Dothistroma septosporum NZE10]